MSKFQTSPIDILSDLYDLMAQNKGEDVLYNLQSQETLGRIDHIDHEQGYIQFDDFRLQIVAEGNE